MANLYNHALKKGGIGSLVARQWESRFRDGGQP